MNSENGVVIAVSPVQIIAIISDKTSVKVNSAHIMENHILF